MWLGADIGNVDEILRNEIVPDSDIFKKFCNRVCPFNCCNRRKRKAPNGSFIPGIGGYLDPLDPDDLKGKSIVLITDGHSWKHHFRVYYSSPQYTGAFIIMYVGAIHML